MQLAKTTGLSYGKIYRILNGTLKKPGPVYLKKLADSLNLNYNQLLNLSGVIATDSNSEKEVFSYPILNWDYCYIAYPFNESITSGISDEHFHYHKYIKDGFCLIIDNTHELNPFFSKKDLIICQPLPTLNPLDLVLYWDQESKEFKFGSIYKHKKKTYIQSFHQKLLNCNLSIEDSIQNPIVAKIVAIKYG